jgi:hypothetical protein
LLEKSRPLIQINHTTLLWPCAAPMARHLTHLAKLFIALGFRRDLAIIIQEHPQDAAS